MQSARCSALARQQAAPVAVVRPRRSWLEGGSSAHLGATSSRELDRCCRRHGGGALQPTAAAASGPDAPAGCEPQQLLGRRAALSAGAALAASAQLAHATPPAAAAAEAAAAAAATAAVPRAALAPTLSVSRVIKGCWQLSGGHKGERDTDRTAGSAAVQDLGAFWDAGITTFDTADHYGPSEALIGRFLRERPGVRSNTQVLTKYCVFSPADMRSVSAASVAAAVDRSRERLGVDRLDLLQFYWADYDSPRYVDAALYLTDLAAKGVIGAVGATNFDVPRLERMMDSGAQVVSNQVQYSLLDRRPQNSMAEFCASRGVSLLPYGVVAGGFLSDRYLRAAPRDVDVNTYSKGKYASVLGQAGGWDWLQRLLAVLRGVADKHGTTISNVASRWVLQRPGVPAIILGARNALHVADHQAIFAFELDGDDEAAIADVLASGRQAKGDCYSWERGGTW